ncbi:MAG: magnesium transporter CorA family protein [Patescibacteria group bacterium]
MIKKQDYNGLTWIDLEAPTEVELKQVVVEYKIHPLAAAELANPSTRSKVDLYSDFIYLILHFPICHLCYGKRPITGEDTEEVDFIIGQNFLLTVHYKPMESLTEFSRIFTVNYFKERGRKLHAGYIFYYLMRHLYNSLSTGLDYVNGVLKQAEQKIFAGEEKAMIQLLASINRNLFDFRWALKTHRQILDSLVVAGQEFFGQGFKYYLATITGEYEKIWNMLESNRETFLDLRQTNESMLSIKTNETIKLLTVLAFIFFPLTIATQFFGMNIDLPLVNQPSGYLIVIGLMVVISAIMFVWARFRRWL